MRPATSWNASPCWLRERALGPWVHCSFSDRGLLARMLGPIPAYAAQTEEKPVCPERPFYHPTDREVAETGLSPEVLCIVGDTYLMRHDIPGPQESPDLLRRFVQRGPYANLSKEQYIAVMKEAVRLWPKSHYAHEGLADALLGR